MGDPPNQILDTEGLNLLPLKLITKVLLTSLGSRWGQYIIFHCRANGYCPSSSPGSCLELFLWAEWLLEFSKSRTLWTLYTNPAHKRGRGRVNGWHDARSCEQSKWMLNALYFCECCYGSQIEQISSADTKGSFEAVASSTCSSLGPCRSSVGYWCKRWLIGLPAILWFIYFHLYFSLSETSVFAIRH